MFDRNSIGLDTDIVIVHVQVPLFFGFLVLEHTETN